MKLHFVCQQGIKNLTDAEAEAIVAKDRESHQRDLYESIEKGDFPRWKMCIQVMPEKDAATCPHNPFDLTKVWPHKDHPLIEVGVMELNRNPENYFAEVEQSAFNPANIVPGIGFSPDKMLQGRLFSYGDAQRYRLGVNHEQIPVNAPAAPSTATTATAPCGWTTIMAAHSAMSPTATASGTSNPEFAEPPLAVAGAADHWNHREDDDYYSQPRMLFRLMKSDQRKALFDNTARAMGDAPDEIKIRHIGNCLKADPAYGEGVARVLGVGMNEVLLREGAR